MTDQSYEVTYSFEINGVTKDSHNPLPKRTFFVRATSKIEAGERVCYALQYRADKLNRRRQGHASVFKFGGHIRNPYLCYLTNCKGEVLKFAIYAQVL